MSAKIVVRNIALGILGLAIIWLVLLSIGLIASKIFQHDNPGWFMLTVDGILGIFSSAVAATIIFGFGNWLNNVGQAVYDALTKSRRQHENLL